MSGRKNSHSKEKKPNLKKKKKTSQGDRKPPLGPRGRCFTYFPSLQVIPLDWTKKKKVIPLDPAIFTG